MAALSAAQHNPAVKPLYQRVRAKHPDQAGIAVGHAMRKLLHLVFAVWHSGKPFDPSHYSWDHAAHLHTREKGPGAREEKPAINPATKTQAAGHNNPDRPERSVVTTACATSSVTGPAAAGNSQAKPAASAHSDMPLS